MKISTLLKLPCDEVIRFLEEHQNVYELRRTISKREDAIDRLSHGVFDNPRDTLAFHARRCYSITEMSEVLKIDPYFIRRLADEWGITLPNPIKRNKKRLPYVQKRGTS